MPRIENLSDYVSTVQALVPASVSGAGFTAAVVDCSAGFSRVRYVINTSTVTLTTGGFDAEVTQASTSGATYTLISGSGLTAVTGTASSEKLYIIDVPVVNATPYQKLRATATTTTLIVSAIADRYNGSRNLPTADDSGVGERVTA